MYYKNKEELFNQLYIEIRKENYKNLVKGLKEEMSIEETFKLIWKNSFNYNIKHPEYLTFREQFEQTTMMKKIKQNQFESHQFVTNLLQRGIDEGIIKNLPLPILTAFAFIPIITFVKYHINGLLKMDEKQIQESTEIAWNTIKK